MKKVTRADKIPESSGISKGFTDFDYWDSFRVATKTSESIDKITTEIFQTPKWADMFMGARNTIFNLAGLDKGGYKKI